MNASSKLFNSFPKVMIVSGYAPSAYGTGPRLLADLCRYYPEDKICCFVADPNSHTDTEFESIPHHIFKDTPLHLGTASKCPLALLKRSYMAARRNRKLTQSALKFGTEQRPDIIWGIGDWLPIVSILPHISRQLDLPLVTSIWDPPDYISDVAGRGRILSKAHRILFNRMMARSERCSVASETMALEYKKLFNTDAIVLRMSIPESIWSEPRQFISNPQRMKLAFAGSLYASDELQSLINALCDANWKLGSCQVEMDILSQGPFPITIPHAARITLWGYRHPDEAQQIVSQSDIGYLPYWFSESRRNVVTRSFPGKIGSYLAAGLPIFYHGPEYGTPTDFIAKYQIGISCHSLNGKVIVQNMKKLLGKGEFTAMTANSRKALSECFSINNYLYNIGMLFGMKNPQLLADRAQAT